MGSNGWKRLILYAHRLCRSFAQFVWHMTVVFWRMLLQGTVSYFQSGVKLSVQLFHGQYVSRFLGILFYFIVFWILSWADSSTKIGLADLLKNVFCFWFCYWILWTSEMKFGERLFSRDDVVSFHLTCFLKVLNCQSLIHWSRPFEVDLFHMRLPVLWEWKIFQW